MSPVPPVPPLPPLPRRPLLKPALRRIWRDSGTLQLGLDEDRSVLLTGLSAPARTFVESLDGSRDLAATREHAASLGLDTAATERLLSLLSGAGVLDDAASDTGVLRALARESRERLAPDLASLSLATTDPGGALAALSRRREATVAVYGAERVGTLIATLLAAAGVGRLLIEDAAPLTPADLTPAGPHPGDLGQRRDAAVADAARRCGPVAVNDRADRRRRPDVAVLAGERASAGEVVRGLVRDGVAHLPARVQETTGAIGPLVLPGRSACLRCLNLHRSDRDPGWPRLAAALATSPPGPASCDVALATAVAAITVLQVLNFLDGELPTTVDGTLELRLPEGLMRRRSWLAHPGCGCRWSPEEEAG